MSSKLGNLRGVPVLAAIVLIIALLACKKTEEDSSQTDDARVSSDRSDEKHDSGQTVADSSAPFKVGDPVDVEWKGDWWKAEVVKVQDGPQYYIHYVGWGNEWDEWVPPVRIRARTAGARTK